MPGHMGAVFGTLILCACALWLLYREWMAHLARRQLACNLGLRGQHLLARPADHTLRWAFRTYVLSLLGMLVMFTMFNITI